MALQRAPSRRAPAMAGGVPEMCWVLCAHAKIARLHLNQTPSICCLTLFNRNIYARRWRWWRDTLAVFKLFWLNAQWRVATWDRISRGPVAGTPAQTERIACDHAAAVLHISAVWGARLQVSGQRRIRWGALGRSDARDGGRCCEQNSDHFFHILFLSVNSVSIQTVSMWS